MKLSKQSDDPVLTRIFSHWKRLLESRQNISAVRAKFPYSHVNHLSCDEAQNHFGGIVSVLPVAMEYARETVERIEVIRAYRIGNKNENEKVSSKPQRTRPHSSCPLSTPRSSANDGVPAGPACRLAQPNSPAVSSPVSSLSEASIRSYRTSDPPVCEAIKSSPRPSTALDTYIKESKARKTPNQSCPRYCAATETPKCLASTLKPALNWPHRTISEEELKKMLKSRKHALTRPEWKP
uniref:Uncharacterized protein n=1 Tax=Ciona savignyi TaxID=51511 RepID=H2ZP01_CIOSA